MLRESIKSAIESKEMTQLSVSIRARVTSANLSRFLNGKQDLGSGAIDRLCTVLGLRLSDIQSKQRDGEALLKPTWK